MAITGSPVSRRMLSSCLVGTERCEKKRGVLLCILVMLLLLMWVLAVSNQWWCARHVRDVGHA